jgi:hypothetical protein
MWIQKLESKSIDERPVSPESCYDKSEERVGTGIGDSNSILTEQSFRNVNAVARLVLATRFYHLN